MRYTSRGLKRRRGSNKWGMTMSHRDPLSGELVSTHHSVEATTLKKAEKTHDELIVRLEANGDAYDSKMTLSDFLESSIKYKEGVMQVERSTVDHYRKQAKVLNRYLGSYPLCDVGIPAINGWMAQMMSEGYAPRSVSKPFGLLRQAMRVLQLMSVVGLVVCVIDQVVSALILSKHALAFLPALPNASWVRQAHMLCSYWSFVFAFAHMGLQFKTMLARMGGVKGLPPIALWLLRIVWLAVAAFGVILFAQLGIADYLFARIQFASADYGAPLALSFARYASIAVLIAGCFHYLRTLLDRRR